MSRKMNEKKSTSKYRNKKGLAPIIPVIAIIEVLVLIAASTYAWYYLAANKTVETDVITVAPDSGLDIDFKNANTNDSINIWEYINDDFKFEPATSLDGRNIYFPTSGTFDSVNTSEMKFRDATVNDINSKYINIDFELTNTNSDTEMEVYLNNSSYFYVEKYNETTNTYESNQSRALRLAFYPNDGSNGHVGSDIEFGSNNNSGSGSGSNSNSFSVYFDNANTGWSKIYAYFFDSKADDNSANGEYPSQNYWNSKAKDIVGWPGVEMKKVAGSIYTCSITNPVVEKVTSVDTEQPIYLLDEEGNQQLDENDQPIRDTFPDGEVKYVVDDSENELTYDMVVFTNNSGKKTADLSLNADKTVYHAAANLSSVTTSTYTSKTIYFAKPSWWNSVYVHTWNGSKVSYSTYPGDEMTYLGSGIYSYEYTDEQAAGMAESGGGLLFNNGNASGDYTKTEDLTLTNGALYYINNQGQSGIGNQYNCTTYTGTKADGTSTNQYTEMGTTTTYFYNSHKWNTPYARVFVPSDSTEAQQSYFDIALTYLSGSVYYCTVPQIYQRAYFKAKNDDTNERTKLIGSVLPDGLYDISASTMRIISGYVYRPTTKDGNGYYSVTSLRYAQYTSSEGYAVISPGVSAGFQRAYAPVIGIDQSTGAATEILPAFANSIDKYINNSEKKLLTLPPNSMMSLSMIIWLEGTDEDCIAEDYAENLIKLRLEFSTQTVNRSETDVYTYRFYDRTNELWTSNTIDIESGQSISPVMQLYDETIKRGYLMHSAGSENNKTTVWAVDAPRSIADYGHDISFRRVNPYNEDEVWNKWEAGPCSSGTHSGTTNVLKGSIYSQAFTLSTDPDTPSIISFTAFADGSPSREILENNKANAPAADRERLVTDVPARSCGGLWGNHTAHKLYVLDGGAVVDEDKNTNLSSNQGLLTIRYTYNYYYTSGGVTTAVPVDIEYCSSGYSDPGQNCYHSIFIFIMPEDIYDKYSSYVDGSTTIRDANNNVVSTDTTCKFRKYQNFKDKYAVNSPYNDELKLFDTNEFTPDNNAPISGDFFEIGYGVDSANANVYSASTFQKNYWGSDILYFQTNYDETSAHDPVYNTASSMYTQFENSSYDAGDGNHLLRVRFFANTEANSQNASGAMIGKETVGSGDAEDFYAILFQNDNFKGSSAGHGFACVVPNDKPYYFYRVENVNNQQNWMRNATKQIKMESTAQPDSAIAYRNYARVGSNADGSVVDSSLSICKMDYYFYTVYFQTEYLADATPTNYMKCHAYIPDFGGAQTTDSVYMTYVGSLARGDKTTYQFKYEIQSKYTCFKFYSVKANKTSSEVTSTTESGIIYEFDNTNVDNFNPGIVDDGAGHTLHACNSAENVYADFWTTDWPHFNAKSLTATADVNY